MSNILIKPMADNLTMDRGSGGLWCVIYKDLAAKTETIHVENVTYDEAIKEVSILANEINS